MDIKKRNKKLDLILWIIILVPMLLGTVVLGNFLIWGGGWINDFIKDPINQTYMTPVNVTHAQVNDTQTNLSDTGVTLSVKEQIKQIAIEHDFQWVDYLLRLAECENDTFDPLRRGDIDPRDRGIFQINSYWHSEVSDECAFDVRCSTEWTMWRINTGWQHEWMCDELI